MDEKIRVVTIFGLPGIGKTALPRELVEKIKDNFDYILWRNCTNTLLLPSLETNLTQFFSQNRETKSSSLIEYLRLSRLVSQPRGSRYVPETGGIHFIRSRVFEGGTVVKKAGITRKN